MQALESQLLRKELEYYKSRVETLESCQKTSQESTFTHSAKDVNKNQTFFQHPPKQQKNSSQKYTAKKIS